MRPMTEGSPGPHSRGPYNTALRRTPHIWPNLLPTGFTAGFEGCLRDLQELRDPPSRTGLSKMAAVTEKLNHRCIMKIVNLDVFMCFQVGK